MLFRQLVHRPSSTYTYLVGSRPGGAGLIIDPVAEHVELYLRLLEALELQLELALDTHLHTDHVSALGLLRERTRCATARGLAGSGALSRPPRSDGLAPLRPLQDGEMIDFDGLDLEVLHTPGHTPDSFSFVLDDRVFTGDTLLIRSTGRTDQGGDPREQYESLSRLLGLPGRTLVYPAHDYHGRHVSTIADERRYNPRLQFKTIDEYVALMNSLRPTQEDHMDVVEVTSLRPSGVLLRELAGLRAALAPTDTTPVPGDVAPGSVSTLSGVSPSGIVPSGVAQSGLAQSGMAPSAASPARRDAKG
jgi:glyoxylase-like metal-dependent hydrolase (beta-lactamase superfamily II)